MFEGPLSGDEGPGEGVPSELVVEVAVKPVDGGKFLYKTVCNGLPEDGTLHAIHVRPSVAPHDESKLWVMHLELPVSQIFEASSKPLR